MLIALLLLWACDRIPDAQPVPTHIVAKGETLGVIAKRYGVTVDELVRWNALPSPDRIEVGQVLVVWSSQVTPPAPQKRKHTRTGSRLAVGPAPPPAQALALPPPQPCRPPPEVVGEHGIAASAGLTDAEVAAAMSAFIQNTLRCVPAGWTTDGTLLVAVRVGCDGRVAAVDVEDDGGLPAEMVRCAADVLRYAPFPAHDQPDGFSFEFPLRFDFGG
jgi:hypothetical protein